MKVGDKVIVRDNGPFHGEEGIVTAAPSERIKGPGVDLILREDQQTAEVKIYGGAIGIFVRPRDLEIVN